MALVLPTTPPSLADLSSSPDWMVGTINIASPRYGSRALRCSDDSFASMERMLQDAPAVSKPGYYDDYGQWMDGWEPKRRRDGSHDWCVVKLGARSKVHGVDIDTSHFTGNYPPAASLWAASCKEDPKDDTSHWKEIVPVTPLGPSAHHFLKASEGGPWNWLRLNVYPDGGIARLRVYGNAAPDWQELRLSQDIELSSLHNGGRVVAYNDAHYGDVFALLAQGRGLNMGDGWETRRRREPGYDWVIVALAFPALVEKIEVDTAHYKGNFPESCSFHAAHISCENDGGLVARAMFWPELMSLRKLSADTIHLFNKSDLNDLGPVTHVRLNIHPDGGVSRLRIFGRYA